MDDMAGFCYARMFIGYSSGPLRHVLSPCPAIVNRVFGVGAGERLVERMGGDCAESNGSPQAPNGA
eukprot:359586-Chlamydomonas_euryale.AAC.7